MITLQLNGSKYVLFLFKYWSIISIFIPISCVTLRLFCFKMYLVKTFLGVLCDIKFSGTNHQNQCLPTITGNSNHLTDDLDYWTCNPTTRWRGEPLCVFVKCFTKSFFCKMFYKILQRILKMIFAINGKHFQVWPTFTIKQIK